MALSKGYDKDKACMLIALDRLYGRSKAWNKTFLEYYYVNTLNCDGWPMSHDNVIYQNSDLFAPEGWITFRNDQRDKYTYVWDRVQNLVYTYKNNTEIIVSYPVKDNITHAECVRISTAFGFASVLLSFYESNRFKFYFRPNWYKKENFDLDKHSFIQTKDSNNE